MIAVERGSIRTPGDEDDLAVTAITASEPLVGVELAAQSGGIAHLDVDQLNAFLLRTPYDGDGSIRPIDAARRR